MTYNNDTNTGNDVTSTTMPNSWAPLYLRTWRYYTNPLLLLFNVLSYKAANSVFGKIGRIASEEVTLQLVKSKCIPILLYGLEVCELTKSQMASLDFTINQFFMKLFSTGNIEIVKSYQEFFDSELPSTLLSKRIAKFKSMYHNQWLVTVIIMNSFTLLPCRKLIWLV